MKNKGTWDDLCKNTDVIFNPLNKEDLKLPIDDKYEAKIKKYVDKLKKEGYKDGHRPRTKDKNDLLRKLGEPDK